MGLETLVDRHSPSFTPFVRTRSGKKIAGWYAVARGRQIGTYNNWCVLFSAELLKQSKLTADHPLCCSSPF